MATFIPGKINRKRRGAAMQTALFHARDKNRDTALVNDLTSLAWGSITFAANPANASTITLGGTVVTFGSTVTIGANLAATLANLLVFLRASADANISKCTYSVGPTSLNIRSKTPNNAALTLAASAATVSHATLRLLQITKRAAL